MIKYIMKLNKKLEEQKRGSKTGVKHEGCSDVLIRDFELRSAYIRNNKVIIENGDGLQGFCRTCSKQRRKARIDKEKSEKKDKTPEEIYELYKEKYNTDLKNVRDAIVINIYLNLIYQ